VCCLDVPVLDLLRHGQECLFDVCSALGGCLEEWDTKLIGKGLWVSSSRSESQRAFLGNGVIDGFLGDQIRFVSDQKLVDTFNCVSVNLLQPLLDIREGIYRSASDSSIWSRQLTAVCDVVDDNDTVSTPVVRRGNGPETFLSSGIPLLDQLRLPKDDLSLRFEA
jgi:hypothetical protein